MNYVLRNSIELYGISVTIDLMGMVSSLFRSMSEDFLSGVKAVRISVDPNGSIVRIISISGAYTDGIVPLVMQVSSISDWLGVVEAMVWLLLNKEPSREELRGTYCYQHFSDDAYRISRPPWYLRTPPWKREPGVVDLGSGFLAVAPVSQPQPVATSTTTDQIVPTDQDPLSTEQWQVIQQSALFPGITLSPRDRAELDELLGIDLVANPDPNEKKDEVSPFVHGPRKIAL